MSNLIADAMEFSYYLLLIGGSCYFTFLYIVVAKTRIKNNLKRPH